MDAFKLLTRSTSLRKATKQSDTAAACIPSAGAPTHPLTISSLPSLLPGQDATSRKRKKGTSSKQAPAEPGISTSGDGQDGENDEEWGGINGEVDLEQDQLSGEECRRLLNQHKLKITLLNPSSTRAAGRAERSKEAKKPGHIRVYPRPLTKFTDLFNRHHVSRRLMENLEAQGFTIPTEVQAGSLPILLGNDEESGLAGIDVHKDAKHSHVDLLTVAPTGSGKTLAFLIPIIQGLLGIIHDEAEGTSSHVRSIVLAPTHELMDQIVSEGKKLAIGTGIKISAMQKGAVVSQQQENGSENKKGADTIIKAHILVSTPLMLLHSLEVDSGSKSLPYVHFLVLDEADVLLDPLFRDQTLAIWNACTSPGLKLSLWSATMGSSIEDLTRKFILDRRQNLSLPSRGHFILRLVVGLKDSSLPTIDHRLIYAGTEQGKLLGLRELLHPSTAATHDQLPPLRPPFLVFTQTIDRARALHSELLYDIPVEAGGSSRIAVLHSELTDRARSDIMTDFRRGEIWVIITTDLLSRGIDFRGVNGVVNYDIPATAAVYVHRAGRTGRAGREGGIAVTLYTREDIPYVKNIANVVAATEKSQDGTGERKGGGIQQWLLDSLPKVSRDTKEDLKRRGIAARRPATGGAKSKEAKRARISTKSGYDRQLEHRRKDAIEKSRRVRASDEGANDDWAGFDD